MPQFDFIEAWLLLVHPDKVPNAMEEVPLSYWFTATGFVLLPRTKPADRTRLKAFLSSSRIQHLLGEQDCPPSLKSDIINDRVEIVRMYLDMQNLDAARPQIKGDPLNKHIFETLLSKKWSYTKGEWSTSLTIQTMLEEGPTSIIEYLARIGANLRYRSLLGTTFLHLAIESRCEALVELLVSNGAQTGARTRENDNALCFAVRYSAPVPIVERLVELGANVNEASGNISETPLLLALRNSGSLTLVKALLDHGADVEADFEYGCVLGLALKRGPKFVACVLNYRPDLMTEKNRAAVWSAFGARCEKSIDLFLGYGFEPIHEDLSNPEAFFNSITSNRAEIVEKLLKLGAHLCVDLNRALCHAAKFSGEKVIKLLLDYGADVNTSHDAETPLSVAVAFANVEATRFLLVRGASLGNHPNLIHTAVKLTCRRNRSDNGRSRLWDRTHYINRYESYEEGNVEDDEDIFPANIQAYSESTKIAIVESLLANGADPNALSDLGKTPIEIAASRSEGEVMKVLARFGAHLDVKSSSSLKYFFRAIRRGAVSAVECYLKHGLDLGTINTKELIISAIRSNPKTILEFLLKFDGPRARRFDDLSLLEVAILRTPYPQMIKDLLEYGHLRLDPIFRSRVFPTLVNLSPLEDLQEIGVDRYGFVSSSGHTVKYDVVRIVCEHVYALRAARLKLNKREYELPEKLQEFCRSSAEFEFKDYESEVKVMKTSKVGEAVVTFYDILNSSLLEVVGFLRDCRVFKVLKSESYGEGFPSYVGMISKRFRKAHYRKCLIEEGIRIFDYLFPQHAKLPHKVKVKILDYLSNQNLLVLSSVREVPLRDDSGRTGE